MFSPPFFFSSPSPTKYQSIVSSTESPLFPWGTSPYQAKRSVDPNNNNNNNTFESLLLMEGELMHTQSLLPATPQKNSSNSAYIASVNTTPIREVQTSSDQIVGSEDDDNNNNNFISLSKEALLLLRTPPSATRPRNPRQPRSGNYYCDSSPASRSVISQSSSQSANSAMIWYSGYDDDPMLMETRKVCQYKQTRRQTSHRKAFEANLDDAPPTSPSSMNYHNTSTTNTQYDMAAANATGGGATSPSSSTLPEQSEAAQIYEDYPRELYSALFDGSPADEGGGDSEMMQTIGNSPSDVSASAFALLEETQPHESLKSVHFIRNRRRNFQSRGFRMIPQTPERILDAPDLLDDFYLNLIDWSSENILAVALNRTVYLWHAESGEIQQLMTTPEEDNIITSVSWAGRGENFLAIGTNLAVVQLWKTQPGEESPARGSRHAPPALSQQTLERVLTGHRGRVGSLSWNGPILASGSRDATIILYDASSAMCIATLRGVHTQEICGLRWSPDGTQLASGGNDNQLIVWDYNRLSQECRPRLRLALHTAAVKALAWNPVQPHLLASGGGTADKTLRFWDTHTGHCLNCIDTHSQVCAIVWSQHGEELVTSHGYSDNQLVLWKYPSLKRLADLTGHTSRVLHLALSPDGQVVVSAAGDETIRFWKCFQSVHTTGRRGHHALSSSKSSSRHRSGGYKLLDHPFSLLRGGGHSMDVPLSLSDLFSTSPSIETVLPAVLFPGNDMFRSIHNTIAEEGDESDTLRYGLGGSAAALPIPLPPPPMSSSTLLVGQHLTSSSSTSSGSASKDRKWSDSSNSASGNSFSYLR